MHLRVAEPGEFTQRAFLNGKIDLAQAEAIADLIDASTEAAARSAGARWPARSRARSTAARRADPPAHAGRGHARLSGRGDRLPAEGRRAGAARSAAGHAGRVMQRARQGALLREGIKVVIAGQPNAGKSSLLNALAGAELAIVTPIPGTTRDVVSQTIQIEGVPLHVIDTAGLRDSDDQVEQIGIERAWGQIERRRRGAVPARPDARRRSRTTARPTRQLPGVPAPQAARQRAGAAAVEQGRRGARRRRAGLQATCACRPRPARASQELRQQLLEMAGWQAAPEGVYIARERHLHALRRVDGHLMEAAAHLAAAGAGAGPAGRGTAAGAERAERDHRRVHRRRPARA
jgi:tRNA modification GTPase